MPDPVTAIIGGGIAGGYASNRAAKKAAKAQTDASNAAIEQEKNALASFENRIRPFEQLRGNVQDPLLAAIGTGQSRDQLMQDRNSLLSQVGSKGGKAYQDYLQKAIARIDGKMQLLPNIPDQVTLPEQVNLNALPQMPTAFNANDLNNPILSFLRDENFRAIKEAGAGGGRNVDRDLADYNAGLMSTVAPQLQQQTFNQQSALRGNALSEQMGQRSQGIAERSGLRSDAINENQQRINNLMAILNVSQNAAVGAGNAGMNAANNIGNSLSDIGSANAQAAINKGNNVNNTLNNLAGGFGMYQGMKNPSGDFSGARRPNYASGGQQMGPFTGGGTF